MKASGRRRTPAAVSEKALGKAHCHRKQKARSDLNMEVAVGVHADDPSVSKLLFYSTIDTLLEPQPTPKFQGTQQSTA